MIRPKSISNAETEETKKISATAWEALNNTSLTDEDADKIISECNNKLLDLGMPKGGLTVSRAAYKN